MKKTFLLFELLAVCMCSSSQQWVNINTPFKNIAPIPIWKQGNYIETIYELDLRNSPDTSHLSEWITVNDLSLLKLVIDISIRNKLYKVSLPAVDAVEGKYHFRLTGLDLSPGAVIEKTNWNLIKTQLSFTSKGVQKETPLKQFLNESYSVSRISDRIIAANRVTYNISDKIFEVNVLSSHKNLEFNSTQILASGAGNSIARFKSQSLANTRTENKVTPYIYKLVLDAEAGFDIPSLVARNNYNVYLKVRASSAESTDFGQHNGLFHLSIIDKILLSDISGNTVFGLTEGKIKVTTSLPATSLKLVFEDTQPFEYSRDLEVIGKPLGQIPSNIFLFTVPSDKSYFEYGKYNIRITGTSNQALRLDTLCVFEKTKIQSQGIVINQVGSKCSFTVDFSEASQGEVHLIFPKSGDIRVMKQAEKKNSYTATINLDDDFVKENLIDEKGDKFITIAVNAFSLTHNKTSIKVSAYVDTKKATSEIEKMEDKRKRREKIIQYLKDNGVEGDFERMADRIISELGKEKERRDWSETWQSVAKFLKPAAGLLMLLL